MTLLREIDPGLARQLHTPFDILVRNFFDTEAPFNPLTSVKLKHPVDVYEDKNGLHLEVACTGLTKKDVGLTIEGDVLRISYEKPNDHFNDREYFKLDRALVEFLGIRGYGVHLIAYLRSNN